MPTSTGQPIEPENTGRSDPERVRRLADRLLELQSLDQSVGIEVVLQELDPSIRPIYHESIKEYLQSIPAAQPLSPNLDTLAPEESADWDLSNEATKITDRARDDATIDQPIEFKAPPRDRALPPAKRRTARDRGLTGKTGDHVPLPECIGKFRIKGELGRGACGVVYLGFDEELQRNVAIKVSLVADPRVQERLRIEASKAAQIDGDGIVPVYHIGTTDAGAVYVVQKYIQGTNLRDILDSDGPVSPARAVRMIGEIAMALEPAHSRNILHRDLKPDNILVDENGKLWIADFGLAISEEEQQGRRGELAGTPVYMSPEQIKGRTDFLDARSDIWALGVMFYELLCGKVPFNGKDREALAEQICERDPRPLHQRSPKYLTEDLNRVFMKCCAKKPSNRYASARELTGALEELIAIGLGEQNINGETISGYVGDSPIDYDTLGKRFSLSVTGQGRLGSAVSSVESGPSVEPTPSGKNAVAAGIGGLVVIVGLLSLGAFEYFKADQQGRTLAENLEPARRLFVPPDEVQANAVPVPEPDPTPVIDADGSSEKPWIVAKDEARSHETIQAAIEQAEEGDFILIKPGTYEEAIRVTKSLTIMGTSPEQCVLLSSTRSPLEIVAADLSTVVRIRNMEVDGSGVEQQTEFNTINLSGGTLIVENCAIRASNHNCIKAGGLETTAAGPMQVIAVNTVFRCREGFAVSLVKHVGAEFYGCDFVRGFGIQLIHGPGKIHCCTFLGEKGVYVSSYSDNFFRITDCSFDKCVEYGLAALDGATAVIEDSLFEGCGFGCRAYATAESPTSGNAALYRTELRDCKFAAADVISGKLLLSDHCVISGGNVGVNIAMNAYAKIVDTEISDVANSGVKLVSGSLVAQAIDIRRSGNAGIEALDGTIDVDGGTIMGSEFEGILVAGKGKHTIRNVVLADNYYGVAVKAPNCDCRRLTISGGDIGVFIENDSDTEAASHIRVAIDGATLGGQQSCGVYVSGDAEVSVENVDFGDLSPEQEVLKVKGGTVTRPDET